MVGWLSYLGTRLNRSRSDEFEQLIHMDMKLNSAKQDIALFFALRLKMLSGSGVYNERAWYEWYTVL